MGHQKSRAQVLPYLIAEQLQALRQICRGCRVLSAESHCMTSFSAWDSNTLPGQSDPDLILSACSLLCSSPFPGPKSF